jgi:S1-C subfamily serine protease
MSMIDLISSVRSGLVQIHVEKSGNIDGLGSGFLIEGGIATNSHVIRPGNVDAILFRMADTDPEDQANYIRMLPEACYQAVVVESPKSERDFAYLQLDEVEFEGRHRFEFDSEYEVAVGEQVVFLGFPFGMSQLTAHSGYISSLFERRGVEIFQIDGSVNGGNSGGPLLNLQGKVIGIVTRAVTGLIEEQFKNLIEALRSNQQALQRSQVVMRVGGVDPIDAIRASQAAMERIAVDLWRSANVGIGYAYSCKYIVDHIEGV